MSRADFDEFIRRQQVEKEVASESFDPELQLREWREHLQALHGTIRRFMAPYIEQGSAEIALRDVELNEEFSGPYTVQQMSLTIGRSTVTFKPIGTMLIGSKGRVDVQGVRGSARLGLVNKNVTRASQLLNVTVSASPPSVMPAPKEPPIEWAWKIITPAPQMQFIDLTENNFFDMILNVTDA